MKSFPWKEVRRELARTTAPRALLGLSRTHLSAELLTGVPRSLESIEQCPKYDEVNHKIHWWSVAFREKEDTP